MEIEYIIDGIFVIAYITITSIIAVYVASKYSKYKQQELLYTSIMWIGLVSSYAPIGYAFISYYFFEILADPFIFMIFYAIIPITEIPWLMIMKRLNIMNKIVVYILITACIIFATIYTILVFIDPNLIGVFIEGHYHMRVYFSLFARIYFIFVILLFLITGLLFSHRCIKSNEPDVRLKGKLLAIGFISIAIGAIMTSNVDIMIIKVIARVILTSSSIELYLGLLLPNWMKNRTIEKNK